MCMRGCRMISFLTFSRGWIWMNFAHAICVFHSTARAVDDACPWHKKKTRPLQILKVILTGIAVIIIIILDLWASGNCICCICPSGEVDAYQSVSCQLWANQPEVCIKAVIQNLSPCISCTYITLCTKLVHVFRFTCSTYLSSDNKEIHRCGSKWRRACMWKLSFFVLCHPIV